MGIRRQRVPGPSPAGKGRCPENDAHAGACLAATALLSALLVLAGPSCSHQMATALGRTPSDGIANGHGPWDATQESTPEPTGGPDPAGSGGDGNDVAGGAQSDAVARAAGLPLSPPVALGASAAAAGTLLLVYHIVRHAVRDGVAEAVLLLESSRSASPGCSPAHCGPPVGRTGGPSRSPILSPTPCDGSPACPDAPRCGQRDR